MEEKRKKKGLLKTAGLILLGAAVLLVAILPVLADGATEENRASILRTKVERKTLERTVAGGGTLSTADPAEVTVPEGVRVTRVLAANGETVAPGDPLAEVDRISVITAITEVQKTLDGIAARMGSLNTGTAVITAEEDGTVYADGKEADGSRLAEYAEYLSLSEQHREYEEILQELIGMFLSGCVTAPAEGLVDGVNKDAAEPLAFRDGARLILLGNEEPVPVYICFSGIVKNAESSTVDLLMNAIPFEVNDFSQIGDNVKDTANMTASWTYPGVYPVYQYADGEWTVSGTLQQLQPGDLVLCVFSQDMSESWIMNIGHGELPPEQPDSGGAGHGGHSGFSGLGGLSGAHVSAAGSGSGETELYSKETTAICSVVPLEEMSFTILVDEEEIRDVTPGMEAQVTVDALPGQSFTGTVTSVSRFGTGNGGSAKYEAVISLPRSEGMLPGMNACALLTAERFGEVLTVPAAALCDRADGSSYVYTGYDEKEQQLLDPVEVEIGFCDGISAEILSGLEEGQTVVYEYYDTLQISNRVEAKGWG